MILDTSLIAELVGTQLSAADFVREDARLLYAAVIESFYADRSIEPLTIAEGVKHDLARAWKVREDAVPETMLAKIKDRDYQMAATDHAKIVRRLSTGRKLLAVAHAAESRLLEGNMTPEEVAGTMSTEALAVTSGTLQRGEIDDWMQTGTTYAKHLQRMKAAHEQGIELAVFTGYPFVDDYTVGIAPQELCFLAGAPGVGKSTVGWCCAQGFAYRQMKKPPEHRIGTLIVSMEMGLIPSATRLAQSITDIDGMKLRAGEINDTEYQFVLREWKAREGLPLYWNYASNFRVSQLRALIVEAIRRYNVGFVVIDHFRQVDPDRYVKEANDVDEIKSRFLKESVAKDLNVAVLCLAHTLKMGRASEGDAARPKLADLRGSGQIAANADFVALLHKPGANLDDHERMALGIRDTDMEIGWAKARHAQGGTTTFRLDPAHMRMSDR